MSARLTFVVPAYNASATLAETIHSVLDQTDPIEIIVVDDGSSDDTSRIARSLGDARLRLVRQRNAGLSAARNAGLREVSTEFVCFLDADDTVAPEYARQMTGAIGSHDLVACAWSFVGPRLEDLAWTCEVLAQDGEPARLLEVNPFTVGCVVHRTVSLREHGESGEVFDPSLPALEDWNLLLRRTLAGAAWAPPISEPLFRYRLRPASMSSDLRTMHETAIRVRDRHAEHVRGAQPGQIGWRDLTLRSLARAVAMADANLIGVWSCDLGAFDERDIWVLAGALRVAIGRADGVNPKSLSAELVSARLAPLALDPASAGRLTEMICVDAAIALAAPRLIEMARTNRVVLAGMGRNGCALAQALSAQRSSHRFAWIDDAPTATCPAAWRRIEYQNLGRADIVVLTPDDPTRLAERVARCPVAMVVPLSGLAQQAPAGVVADAATPWP